MSILQGCLKEVKRNSLVLNSHSPNHGGMKARFPQSIAPARPTRLSVPDAYAQTKSTGQRSSVPPSTEAHRSEAPSAFDHGARWLRLGGGLAVFAAGLALMVRADLGLSSWDVLHDAVRLLSPLTFGQAVIAVSVVVVLASFALGIRLGPGTVANVIFVGVFTDAWLGSGLGAQLGSSDVVIRLTVLIGGVAAIAFGTALYIGANLGAGPRDSLMLAVAKRVRISPGAARAGIELSVLVAGVALGGTAGIGTLVFALLIGPAINLSFRSLGMDAGPHVRSRLIIKAATRMTDWGRRGQLGPSSSAKMSRGTGGRI